MEYLFTTPHTKGQDRNTISALKPNDILELQYDTEEKIIRVFYKGKYLGGKPSNKIINGHGLYLRKEKVTKVSGYILHVHYDSKLDFKQLNAERLRVKRENQKQHLEAMKRLEEKEVILLQKITSFYKRKVANSYMAKYYRTNHCWHCKRHLNTIKDPVCYTCEGMICACSACMCGREY